MKIKIQTVAPEIVMSKHRWRGKTFPELIVSTTFLSFLSVMGKNNFVDERLVLAVPVRALDASS